MATLQERTEVIGYLEKMRDDARGYVKLFPSLNDPSRTMWTERAEKLDKAVKILAEVECAK